MSLPGNVTSARQDLSAKECDLLILRWPDGRFECTPGRYDCPRTHLRIPIPFYFFCPTVVRWRPVSGIFRAAELSREVHNAVKRL